MKVTRRYNQSRRDLSIDMECESCGAKDSYGSAYDDYNFWANVVPSFKCKQCGNSSIDIGAAPEDVSTRYAPHEVV